MPGGEEINSSIARSFESEERNIFTSFYKRNVRYFAIFVRRVATVTTKLKTHGQCSNR